MAEPQYVRRTQRSQASTGSAEELHDCIGARRASEEFPLRDQRGFLDAIIRQSSSVGKKVILAFSDSSLLPLVRNAGSVAPHSVTLLPSNLEHFYTAFDKALTLTL